MKNLKYFFRLENRYYRQDEKDKLRQELRKEEYRMEIN